MPAVWDEIKSRLSAVLSRSSFALWIDPITVIETKNRTLVLGCPNKFSRNWVMENYMGLIEEGLHSAGASHMDIVLKVQAPTRKNPAPHRDLQPAQLSLPNMALRPTTTPLRFNSAFTFDRFIVGRSNEFAYSASRALAQESQLSYQTLLMLANTGLGKTHLSHAVGNAILEHNPTCRVLYTTAEQFTNELISSLKNNHINAFKEKYRRGCDVLLLDEVHFLSGKQKTQMELGYTLDVLTNDNKKIIFTSSVAPKDVPRLSKELSSRLTSGLVATIDSPDYETRVKILAKKAFERNMKLSKDILHLLASRLKRDVRQLECALNYLKAKSELLKARIDTDLAKDVIHCLVSERCGITSGDVRKLVCKYYKVDPETLSSKSRKKEHAYPRNVYAYLCRKYTHEALEQIAKTINRSHSTVVYASELIERKIKTDPRVRHQLEFLSERLESLRK